MGKKWLALVVLWLPTYLSADTSLSSIAGDIDGMATILGKLMWAACVIVGIALIVTAMTQFQAHRDNPKLVPLVNPITYLILALVSISIPFLDKITGWIDGFSGKKQSSAVRMHGLD